MKIVPHRRESTDTDFTSQVVLSAFAEAMSRLGLSRLCDSIIPKRGNNRGYHAASI